MPRSGADLALLLLAGYRNLVDEVVRELAARGYGEVRPAHEYAMRAIRSGAESASELGRALAISKQAAAKTIAALEERGFVAREDDPADARRKRLRVTERGLEVMRTGEEIFDELRARLARRLGAERLDELEKQLTLLVGDAPLRLDAPGWAAQEA